jgi:hypothetical protein
MSDRTINIITEIVHGLVDALAISIVVVAIGVWAVLL